MFTARRGGLGVEKSGTQIRRRQIIRAKLKRVIILLLYNNNNNNDDVLPSASRHSPDNAVITAPDDRNNIIPVARDV